MSISLACWRLHSRATTGCNLDIPRSMSRVVGSDVKENWVKSWTPGHDAYNTCSYFLDHVKIELLRFESQTRCISTLSSCGRPTILPPFNPQFRKPNKQCPASNMKLVHLNTWTNASKFQNKVISNVTICIISNERSPDMSVSRFRRESRSTSG
jgi:hypothetical protein